MGATQLYIPNRLTLVKTLVSYLFRLGRIVSQQSRLTVFGAVASVAALFICQEVKRYVKSMDFFGTQGGKVNVKTP